MCYPHPLFHTYAIAYVITHYPHCQGQAKWGTCDARADRRSCDGSCYNRRGCNTRCGGLLTRNLVAAALRDTRTSRYQFTDNDVLFETNQMIGLRFNRQLLSAQSGLLEGGRRQEAIGIQGRLGDTEQHG